MGEAQDMGAKRRRGRPRKPVDPQPAPKRKRGAQPGNTNAVKTNAHGRQMQRGRGLRRQVRAFQRSMALLIAEAKTLLSLR